MSKTNSGFGSPNAIDISQAVQSRIKQVPEDQSGLSEIGVGFALNEQWRELSSKDGSNWRICDSPLVTQGFDDPGTVPFDYVQSELERAFVGLSLTGVHWVEAFFAFLNGERNALDVQLDGNPWPEGNRIVECWDFQPAGGYQSGRYFFLALSA